VEWNEEEEKKKNEGMKERMVIIKGHKCSRM
jgi:hypothetical protein